jgi:DNA-binding response OmpR family regulator
VSKRKLLLADDSITIQKVVNLTFADEGIEVISVGDGDSALRKFDEFMPDLVMADVNMPGKNGYEVCRLIKQTEETRNIPVILLVGSFEPFDETEAKDAGADDFLTKPFQSIRQLVNKVTDLLNRKEHVSESEPTETQAEAQPAASSDSFAETLEFDNPEQSSTENEKQEAAPADFETRQEISSEFGDAGMDDEMIETSSVNEYVSGSELPYQAETAIDYAKTQPLNAEDLKGFDIVSGEISQQETATAETSDETTQRAEPATFEEEARKLADNTHYEETTEERPEISETEPQVDYYLPQGEGEFEKQVTDAETLEPEVYYSPEQEPREADFSEAPAEETDETAQTPPSETEFIEAQEGEERFEESVETFEPPQTDRGFIESQEDEERFEDFQPETAPETESAEREETQNVEAKPESEFETGTETPVSAPENIPLLSFDDGDLLELPPLVEETGIRPQPKVEPVVSEPEPVAPETAAEPEAETTETPTTAETEAAMAFPPELIEAIAQKVAEKISAKTMSDVLPQITELVMKKLAEENQENKK